MKKILSIILISIFLLNLILQLGSSDVESKFISNLGNPNDGEDRIIVLDGSGETLLDGTTYFNVPLGQGYIIDAQLNVTVMDNNNNYPLNPTINVGMDHDIEWQFKGTGYGAMGNQEHFVSDKTKHTVAFTSPTGGSDYSANIKLPSTAKVTSADISLKGRFSQPDFNKYEFPRDTGFTGAKFVEMGDINNDTWPDAIITSDTQNKLVWYENDKTPTDTEWVRHEITGTLSRAWTVAVADMDGDTDQDVVATSNDPSTANNYGIFWYENVNTTNSTEPGNGSAWTAHRIDTKTNYIRSPQSIQIADLDNDGDNDLVVGSNDFNHGGVYWFENKDGKGTSWNNYTIYHESLQDCRVTDISVGKINNSAGDLFDVVAVLYGQGYAVWFENDGDPINTAGTWPRHNIYFRSNPSQIEIGDMNLDGKNDVVVGYSQSSGIYWYKAPADVKTATSWNTNYRISWNWIVTNLKVAKINNDNYLDVISTADSWSTVYFFKNNNPSGTSFSQYSIDFNCIDATGIAVTNVDKDSAGRDIIITGDSSPIINWYKNGGGLFPSWQTYPIEELTLYRPQGIFSADIDSDGDNDTIITGNGGGDLVWYEAPNDPTNISAWVPHVIENNLAAIFELFVEDINGDGRPDVAVTAQNPSNKVVWYECPASPELVFDNWNMIEVDPYLFYAWGIHIADIDDDGDNDIVATGRSSNDITWYRNNDVTSGGTGNGLSWNKYYIDNNFNYPTGVWVEDMDGDTDLDVVTACGSWSSGTGVVWYEAPADPTGSWTKHTIDTSPSYVYDVHVADIDRDGHPDVVIAPNRQTFLRWYEAPDNPGSGGKWQGHDIWKSSSPWSYLSAHNLWVDDIGNDGYLDIVVGVDDWNWHNVWWFEAPDEPTLAGQWPRYTVDFLSNPRGVFIADIDGDNIQDIMSADWGANLVTWHKVNIEYPSEVTLKIDSNEIMDVEGVLDLNPKESNDFAAAVNAYLASHQENPIKDDYGNGFIDVRITTTAQTAGRITLEDVDILYDYTAAVRIAPDDANLASEITDLVPSGKNGTHRIYVGFTSETKCKVKLSDLSLEYNGAPECIGIPDRSIEEDLSVADLYDFREFFNDDYLEPGELEYELVQWTNSDYIDMDIKNSYYLSVDCKKAPNTNWFGESEVVISVKDTYQGDEIVIDSNTFIVQVLPVDDTPFIKNRLQDVKLLMNTTNTNFDLDRTRKPFFGDIDSNMLYYDFHVKGEYKDHVTVNLSTEMVLEISAVGGACKNITVTVYCDDEPFTKADLDKIEVFQEFQVEVLEIIDENLLQRPRWRQIPDCILEEDHPGLNNWISLPNFVDDYDDDPKTLEYSIISISNNGHIEVWTDLEDHIDIIPFANFDGISEVVLKATDDSGNYGYGKFEIKMEPVNDRPEIEFLIPMTGAKVSKLVEIRGYAEDIEGADVEVQLQLGSSTPSNSNPWIDIDVLDGQWSYIFDTTAYTERTNELLSVRAFDGELYSENVSINIIIDNTRKDSDGDRWPDINDQFPLDPKEWVDSDNDGVGDNADPFPDEPTQWSDLDSDGFGDNPTGKGYDLFPYDPTQQKDRDLDGYGDNPDGNNPDHYPYDPDYHGEGTKESEESQNVFSTMAENPLLPFILIVIILLIINTYLFTYLFLARSGKLAARRAAKAEKAKEKEKEAQAKLIAAKEAAAKGRGEDKAKDREPDKFKRTSSLPVMKPIVFSSAMAGPDPSLGVVPVRSETKQSPGFNTNGSTSTGTSQPPFMPFMMPPGPGVGMVRHIMPIRPGQGPMHIPMQFKPKPRLPPAKKV